MTISVSRTASAAECGDPHADGIAGGLEVRAAGFGKQDIPGGDALDAFVTQAGGDRLAGFAEADEGNARCVAAGHGQFAHQDSGTPGTGGVPLV